MEKTLLTPAKQAAMQATLPGFAPLADSAGRSSRARAPIDRERARKACAPMGTLVSVAVTVDAHERRRTWYVVEPDPALAGNYAAHGLDITAGAKVLIDGDAMRPVALIEVDPASASDAESPAPLGFNPYWDLPPT
jgi:hypothetical protein